MALMNCPECNKRVSDLAASCPNCGYPINKKLEYIRIKLELADTAQSVTITTEEGEVIWTGHSGEIAQIGVEGTANIIIKYKFGIFDAPKSCKGRIDPSLSRRWLVKANNKRLSADIVLTPVNSFSVCYEYKVVKIDKYDERKVEKQIEQMDKDNWELISVQENSSLNWIMFFKRPYLPAIIEIDNIKP